MPSRLCVAAARPPPQCASPPPAPPGCVRTPRPAPLSDFATGPCAGAHDGHCDGDRVVEAAGEAVLPQAAGVRPHVVDFA
eukprot:1172277-Prymnesium_polylepis.2